ncbi:acetylxylan esterase [Nesterenkonia sp. F]|uniref:poly(ethylene terephthalate) hydrolase family protein n=1 Tax=Nesterenkonia sp. F TaxID=795955 RepID=UPI000255D23B|nr:acetylxylan esterase [Nesterenkonia sp. F]
MTVARAAARHAAALLVAGAVVVGLVTASAPPRSAPVAEESDPAVETPSADHARGPDPTATMLRQPRGPFSVEQRDVPAAAAEGFGEGTLHLPAAGDGDVGMVAISPGYGAQESAIAWMGPRLASFGFAVITLGTESLDDEPSARGRQLLAALDHVAAAEDLAGRVDEQRQAVIGHSMGGGGALRAAAAREEIDAVVPVAPWHPRRGWSAIEAATLVLGAEEDRVAPVDEHALPIYAGLTGTRAKAYLELRGADHLDPLSADATIAAHTVAWLKRHLDDDARYARFIAPAEDDAEVSAWRRG